MTTKIVIFCLFLFLGSALITLGIKQQHHFRQWLPNPMTADVRPGREHLVKPNVAFATFLSATTVSDEEVSDDEDGYFLSTRVLAYQLLHSRTAGTNSSIPFLVLCTEDVTPRKRARLEKDGATVIVVEKLKSDWMKPYDTRWAELLTKLRLFEQTQYNKICYMDSDTMVTSSLDGVFYDEATLSQTTMDNPVEIKDDEAALPRSYMLASHTDFFGYDHPYPPPMKSDYLNCGFLVFSPAKSLFNYYMSLANIPDRFDSGFMEQNLLNYAHRPTGNMPWRPLWYGWNVNWPTEKDWRGGAKSFHAKYWDSDPSHDPILKAIWKEQRAEMEGFYRGRELGGH